MLRALIKNSPLFLLYLDSFLIQRTKSYVSTLRINFVILIGVISHKLQLLAENTAIPNYILPPAHPRLILLGRHYSRRGGQLVVEQRYNML